MALNLGELFVTLGVDTRQLKKANKQVTGFAAKTKMAFKTIAPLAGLTAGAVVLGNLVREAVLFQAEMSNVKALAGATNEEFIKLNETAKDLGRTTKFTAKEAGEGMSFLAMAGFEANEIIGAMPGVLELASAATLDLGRAADITSNIMTGYGKDVSELGHVNDVLVKAFTSANVNLSMLGQSMKFVGPVAKAAGVEFEETAAAVALLGNAGIQGSMAGSSLRNAITRIINPSKDAAKVLNRMGVSAKDVEGNFVGIQGIVEQFEIGLASMGGETERASALMEVFGQRAGPSMAALVDQGSVALRDFTQTLRDSAGIAERISKEKMDNVLGAWLKVKSAVTGFAIEMFETVAPAIQKAFEIIADGVNIVTDFWQVLDAGPSTFFEHISSVSEEFKKIDEDVNKLNKNIKKSLDPTQFSSLDTWIAWGKSVIDTITFVFKAAGRVAASFVTNVILGWDLLLQSLTMVGTLVVKSIKAMFTKESIADIVEAEMKKTLATMDATMAKIDADTKTLADGIARDYETLGIQLNKNFGLWAEDIQEPAKKMKSSLLDAFKSLKVGLDDFWKRMNDAVWGFGQTISSALADAVVDGKMSFESLFNSFLKMITRMIIQIKLVEPAMRSLGLMAPSATTQTVAPATTASAMGNVFGGGKVMAFAQGGVVSGPTIFPMANGAGLMGEAGPEAVMPLQRTAGGKLGVSAEGLMGSNVNVIINNNSGAEVRTEERSKNGGKEIEVWIDNQIGKSLSTGSGARVLDERYGVKPNLTRR